MSALCSSVDCMFSTTYEVPPMWMGYVSGMECVQHVVCAYMKAVLELITYVATSSSAFGRYDTTERPIQPYSTEHVDYIE